MASLTERLPGSAWLPPGTSDRDIERSAGDDEFRCCKCERVIEDVQAISEAAWVAGCCEDCLSARVTELVRHEQKLFSLSHGVTVALEANGVKVIGCKPN